jgi:hypothetical protein
MKIIGVMGAAGSGKDTVGGFLRGEGWATLAFADPLKAFVRDLWNLPDEVLWGPSELRELAVYGCPCGWTGVNLYGDERDGVCCGDTAERAPILTWVCRTCRASIVGLEQTAYGLRLGAWQGGDGWTTLPTDDDPTCLECEAPLAVRSVPLSARLALQRLGTEYGRALDPDVWVRLGIRRAKALLASGTPLLGTGPSPGAGIKLPADAEGYPRRPEGVALTDARFPNEAAAIRAAGGVIWRVYRPPAPVALSERAGASAEPGWRSHASETAADDVHPDAVIVNDGTLDDLRAVVKRALAAFPAAEATPDLPQNAAHKAAE